MKKYEPVMRITTQAEADVYFEKLVADSMKLGRSLGETLFSFVSLIQRPLRLFFERSLVGFTQPLMHSPSMR
jgi:hypothetical protein